MGQALYRRYRSESFDDVLGQEHITKTLKTAVKNGRIAHAYLFTGPRGVGKTSVARILAHEVNNLSYPSETAQLDIIEIDAASNRRIDEIRDLRDRVHIAPTSSKYKVYIIDEVHMLTKEAFNALLKTLEEPPAHCIFILATTEAHKVPETIVSRTQKYVFKPVGRQTIAGRLAEIARNEKVEITKEALDLLADHSEGSFRDSISMLDQLGSSGQKIDAELVRSILGLPQQQQLNDLMRALEQGDSQKTLTYLDALSENAVDPADLAKSLASKLRKEARHSDLAEWQIELLKNLLRVAGHGHGSQNRLELVLLEAAATNAGRSTVQPLEPENTEQSDEADEPGPEPRAPPQKNDPEPIIEGSPNSKPFDLTDWPAVLAAVKGQAASLYTALRLAEPSLEGKTLRLAFQFPLHQKKLDSTRAKEVISQIIFELTQDKVAIVCELQSQPAPASASNETVDSVGANFQSISNIFGGGEVLESETIS